MRVKNLSRRDFLTLTLGGAAAALMTACNGGSPPSPASSLAGQSLRHAFRIGPESVGRLDQMTGQVSDISPWEVPAELEHLVPQLLPSRSFNLDDLEAWVDGTIQHPSDQESIDALEAAMQVTIEGVPYVADIKDQVVDALLARNNLDLSLDFEQVPASFPDTDSLQERQTLDLFGWKLQFRGPATHSLGSCVSQPVKHHNVEIFHRSSRGSYDYVANFHLGTYRNGSQKCFVLYNNVPPRVCWKICTPSRNDLAGMFKWMLAAAAAAAGVAIAGWALIIIAETAASVWYAPLLLL